MQQCRSIRKHRIDVDLFDVWQMWYWVIGQIQIAQMLDGTIIGRNFVHSYANLIEGISRLPFVLCQHADNQQ